MRATEASEPPAPGNTSGETATAELAARAMQFQAWVQSEPMPERIGPYRLLRILGRGGMGVVYEAEEDHPRRAVALKVISPGMLSGALLRRFEFEADVLARLEHPGIARIYRAGTADAGNGVLQPFFAMELVRGRRLDVYAREEDLTLARRIELLLAICRAVHHAHTKGVIHRDLKPANILVTEDGQPRILDFGVARLTNSDLQASTAPQANTQSGQLVGTLPYMAPEQAAGRVHELDTSSDVYALGVIAYELLSGKMPYALDGRALHEAVRVICEDEPTRLSRIDRSLRGDIETIIGKAMEKEKTRRYATAGELAADLKRYLDYEPISARPPGTWYQLGKFARRNKALVAGVTAVVITLSAGLAGTTIGLVRAERQRRQAVAAKETAESINQFMRSMFEAASPNTAQGREVTVRELLEQAARDAGPKFANRPLVEAAVRQSVADSFSDLGRADLALPQYQRALELQSAALGPDNPETLASRNNLAVALRRLGRFAEAEPILRDVLSRRRRLLGDGHPDTLITLQNLAQAVGSQGGLDESEKLLRELIQHQEHATGVEPVDMVIAYDALGHLVYQRGRDTEAEPIARHAVELAMAKLGPDHPQTLTAKNNLSSALVGMGRFAEAEKLCRETLQARRKVLGPQHPETIGAANNLANLLLQAKRLKEAESLFRETLEQQRKAPNADPQVTIALLSNLATTVRDQGRVADAEPLHREALERSRAALGPLNPITLTCANNLGMTRYLLGQKDQAEALFKEAADGRKQTLGPSNPETVTSLANLAVCVTDRAGLEAALPLYREMYDAGHDPAVEPQRAARYMSGLGPVLVQLKRYSQAEPVLLEALEKLHAASLDRHPRTTAVLQALVKTYDATDRPEQAERYRRQLEAISPPRKTAASTTAPANTTQPTTSPSPR